MSPHAPSRRARSTRLRSGCRPLWLLPACCVARPVLGAAFGPTAALMWRSRPAGSTARHFTRAAQHASMSPTRGELAEPRKGMPMQRTPRQQPPYQRILSVNVSGMFAFVGRVLGITLLIAVTSPSALQHVIMAHAVWCRVPPLEVPPLEVPAAVLCGYMPTTCCSTVSLRALAHA